jgi:hypothetical protein
MKCEHNAVRQWDFRENLCIEGLTIPVSFPEIADTYAPYNRMTISK